MQVLGHAHRAAIGPDGRVFGRSLDQQLPVFVAQDGKGVPVEKCAGLTPAGRALLDELAAGWAGLQVMTPPAIAAPVEAKIAQMLGLKRPSPGRVRSAQAHILAHGVMPQSPADHALLHHPVYRPVLLGALIAAHKRSRR